MGEKDNFPPDGLKWLWVGVCLLVCAMRFWRIWLNVFHKFAQGWVIGLQSTGTAGNYFEWPQSYWLESYRISPDYSEEEDH